MKKNSIQQFFEDINITYDDLPYLYLPLLAVTGLTLAGWVTWGQSAVLWGILILTTYIILATQFHLYRSTQKDLEDNQRKIQAYFSLYSSIDFRGSLPYMTGWAATPELALLVHEEIKENKPGQILELGSGISTIVASYSLQQNGKGSIMSLDHDEAYANKTRADLKKHGTENFADVRFAPLISYELDGSKWDWYNLDSQPIPPKVDLLLVDGPPVKTNNHARYPALPLLADKLSDNAVIIIHDAYRKSEREILDKWKKQFPEFSIERHRTEKGIAILRK